MSIPNLFKMTLGYNYSMTNCYIIDHSAQIELPLLTTEHTLLTLKHHQQHDAVVPDDGIDGVLRVLASPRGELIQGVDVVTTIPHFTLSGAVAYVIHDCRWKPSLIIYIWKRTDVHVHT